MTSTKQKVKASNTIKQSRIRIRLKSFDSRSIDQSASLIVQTAQGSGAKVIGPVPLPTALKRWCIITSPHVNKKTGGEHYQIKIHKRMIDIIDPPSLTVDALMQIDLPAGVNIEIKLN